ncbi:MAG: substrate-binding domain-containing protein [Planctomycetes bacterium]|nr:substrate-binding domain-containing protein [Planctomycetota bacterium]
MATTTSVENSGLLAHLLPHFKRASGLEVKVIAVGTGRALKLGEDGEVDLLLVHSPEAEKEFLAQGFGTSRQEIMYNDFVLLGPAADPAKLRSTRTLPEVMARLAMGGSPFISRGDNSGTHHREKGLWAAARIEPKGDWYLEVGQGMGPALFMASEKQGYVLADRGTFLSLRARLELEIIFEGGPALLNVYSVILVNPVRHPGIRNEDAQKFMDWILSGEGQKRIGEFTVEGQQLFHPQSLK